MKQSLREILAESHIAAIAIAALLFWSVVLVCQAIWEPLSKLLPLLFTAIAIFDIPYFSFVGAEWYLVLIITSYDLIGAFTMFATAWYLSRVVYGIGPFQSLSIHINNGLKRSPDV